ncbi:MAG: type II secretion system protein GspM [Myxococcota bacterium]|jgi:type II secretory pathway component PulM
MLRKLFDRLGSWWEGISDREKQIVLIAGGVAVALIFIGVIFSVSSRLSEAETRITEKEQKLSEIVRLRGDFRQAESTIKAMEMRLKGNNVNLFSYIEDLARRMKVDVSDMNERTSGGDKDSKIKEVSVEVNMNKVTQDRLLDFLSKLEQGPELIKVTKMRLRTRMDGTQKLIDANITISTYKVGT